MQDGRGAELITTWARANRSMASPPACRAWLCSTAIKKHSGKKKPAAGQYARKDAAVVQGVTAEAGVPSCVYGMMTSMPCACQSTDHTVIIHHDVKRRHVLLLAWLASSSFGQVHQHTWTSRPTIDQHQA